MTNQILPLFPTVIYQCKLDGFEEWRDLLLSKKEYQFDPNDGDPHLTGEFRDKCLMHKDEDLMSFFAEVTDGIYGCLEAAGVKKDMHIPYIMKSWFTIKDKSDMLGEHRHACSDLSFVYYLTGGQLCFKQEWNANQYFGGMLDAKPPERSHIDNETFFTTKVAATTVAPGDLLVFPSNLLHFVMPEEGTDTVVRSVAGDIKLMLTDEYTNLETGLIHYSHWRKFNTKGLHK